jgi:hypothetical protein
MTCPVAPLVTALGCRSNSVAELPILAPLVRLDASSNLAATQDGRRVVTAQPPGVVRCEDARLLETPFLSVADDLQRECELPIAGHANGTSHRIILPDDDDAGWPPVEALVLDQSLSPRRVGKSSSKLDLETRRQARSGARSAGCSTCMT